MDGWMAEVSGSSNAKPLRLGHSGHLALVELLLLKAHPRWRRLKEDDFGRVSISLYCLGGFS